MNAPIAIKAKLIPNAYMFILCLVLNIAPLVLQLSSWLIALIFIVIIWQLAIIRKLVPKPNKLLKLLVAVGGSVLLIISAKQLGLLLTMVHLLVLAYLLKPLEIYKNKDHYQLILIGLFVLLSAFIFYQDLYFFVLVLTIFFINLVYWFSLFVPHQPLTKVIKFNGLLFLQALPLMVVMFLIFPKLSPFWQVPYAKSSETGLSDEVNIGDIANLALSNKLAFRVEFTSVPPEHSELYWRTLVLENYDGNKWFQKYNAQTNNLVRPTDEISVYNYQVFAEASQQQWLFALDVAFIDNSFEQEITSLKDFTLINKKKIRKTKQYKVTSFSKMMKEPNLGKLAKQTNLTIQKDSNPKLEEKGRQLAKRYEKKTDIIEHVLAEFEQAPYRYTLKPPQLNGNRLDQFYFDTKAGFCEHYASSFTYLMRAAGIPARLVLGYMGGEYNASGKYYSIYQRNAHAWSEVWLAGKGWQRVDPTGAVNPDRVENGFSDLLLAEQDDINDVPFFVSEFSNSQWLLALRQSFEAIDYQWTKWVIGYSVERQFKLLSSIFGGDIKWKSAGVFVFSLIIVIVVFWFIQFLSQRLKNKKTKIQRYLEQFLAIAEKKGYKKEGYITYQEFILTLSKKFPTEALPLAALLNSYQKLQFKALDEQERLVEQAKFIKAYKQIKRNFRRL